jgi:dimethylamine/trimethylamine dehydrogenase
VIYDDEHYFMGSALAERLRRAGHEVALVTPQATASYWTAYTDEQAFVQARLIELGVALHLSQRVTGWADGQVQMACAYTGRAGQIAGGTLILVTGRLPDDGLYRTLETQGIVAARVGDCLQPSSIADAVYSGHRFARFLGTDDADLPPRRERPAPR